MTNCEISISRMTGDETNKEYVLLVESKQALIVPAGNDIVALYGDVPMGGLHSFLIYNMAESIKSEDKITIISAGDSGLSEDDELVVSGISREIHLLGNHIIEGVAARNQ